MKLIKTGLPIFLSGLFACSAAGADSAAEPWRYIPDDARWAVVVRVGDYLESETGKRLTERFHDERAERWTAGVRHHFGMDPMTEIDTVILYGPDADKESGTAVILGDFSHDEALRVLAERGGYGHLDHGRHRVHVWEAGAAAYPRPGVAVLARRADLVKRVLDTLDGERAHLPADDLNGRAEEGWFLRAFAEEVSALRDIPPKAMMLRYSSRLDLTLGEGDGEFRGTLRMEVVDGASASKLTEMLRALLFYAPLMKDPDDPFVTLVKYASVEPGDDGKSVALYFSVPLSELPF